MPGQTEEDRFKQTILRFYQAAATRCLPSPRAQNLLARLTLAPLPSPLPPLTNTNTRPRSADAQGEPERVKITVNGEEEEGRREGRRGSGARVRRGGAERNVAALGALVQSEWVYSSADPGRVVTFAYLSACVLREYQFGFDKLYALIRDQVREQGLSVPPWITAAEREWNLIRPLMTRQNGEWERQLRRFVEGLTDLFTQLVLALVCPLLPGHPLSPQTARRLAFFAEAAVVHFVLNFKELRLLERTQDLRSSGRAPELAVGLLEHCGTYVVARRVPKEREEAAVGRELRRAGKVAAQESLSLLSSSDDYYETHKFKTFLNEKQVFARKFIRRRLARYGLDTD